MRRILRLNIPLKTLAGAVALFLVGRYHFLARIEAPGLAVFGLEFFQCRLTSARGLVSISLGKLLLNLKFALPRPPHRGMPRFAFGLDFG